MRDLIPFGLTALACWAKRIAMQRLVAGFKYLTIWGHFSATQPPPATVGAAAIYFPLVGLVLGLLLVFLNYYLAVYLASEILSILLIAVLTITTGAIHLEGTKNTFDAMARKMPQAGNGHILGFVAIVFVILFKTGAIDVMDERLAVSLLLTPVAARWALVIFLYGYHDRCEEAPRIIAANVKLWHLVIATAATLGLAVLIGAQRTVAGSLVGICFTVAQPVASSPCRSHPRQLRRSHRMERSAWSDLVGFALNQERLPSSHGHIQAALSRRPGFLADRSRLYLRPLEKNQLGVGDRNHRLPGHAISRF
jgi:adenosylcobinamide-GDP ribazoletransferase